MNRKYEAVNWNEQTSDIALLFLEQNQKQVWYSNEFAISHDLKSWRDMKEIEKDVYMKVLGGLTLLDTQQANVGMPKIAENVKDLQEKSVLSFMGMMEHVHAQSYSTIFTTLASKKEIDNTFEWIKENQWLQKKVDIIMEYYENITDDFSLAKSMIMSCFLETFLFFSSFYYPIHLAAYGKLQNSIKIIKLIIRDETI